MNSKTFNSSSISEPLRSDQLSALMRLPPELLIKQASQLAINWEVTPVTLPQSGLGLLKMQDSAFHEAFFLGEIPVSSAHLSIQVSDELKVEGAALMMTDDTEVIQALAIFDAILAHHLQGWDQAMALVNEGQQIQTIKNQKRKQILAKTRVDFSLLDGANEYEEETDDKSGEWS